MQSQVVVTIKLGERKEIHKLILQEFQYGNMYSRLQQVGLLTALVAIYLIINTWLW